MSVSKPSVTFKGTWSGTSTITDTAINDTRVNLNDIDVGDEITVVDGYGRGYTAHVKTNDGSNLTLDETIGTDGELLYYTVDSFKKLFKVSNTKEMQNYITTVLDQKGPWVQIKVDMRGLETEVGQLYLSNKVGKQ